MNKMTENEALKKIVDIVKTYNYWDANLTKDSLLFEQIKDILSEVGYVL